MPIANKLIHFHRVRLSEFRTVCNERHLSPPGDVLQGRRDEPEIEGDECYAKIRPALPTSSCVNVFTGL
jgi:hypothetical protein